MDREAWHAAIHGIAQTSEMGFSELISWPLWGRAPCTDSSGDSVPDPLQPLAAFLVLWLHGDGRKPSEELGGTPSPAGPHPPAPGACRPTMVEAGISAAASMAKPPTAPQRSPCSPHSLGLRMGREQCSSSQDSAVRCSSSRLLVDTTPLKDSKSGLMMTLCWCLVAKLCLTLLQLPGL